MIQCEQIPCPRFNIYGTPFHRLIRSMLHTHHSSKYIEYAFKSCLLVYREEMTWIYCRNLYNTCIYIISILMMWEYRDYTVISDKSAVSMNGYISIKILSVWCLEWSSIFCCYRNIIVCYASVTLQAFSSDLQSLQQRTWFIHWSLFVFFNHPKGGDLIIDMFLVDNKHDNK